MKPQNLSEYALLCLEALSRSSLRDKLSLGGAVGLMHYFEYRATHDVDAWWTDSAGPADRLQITTLLEATLAPFGDVRTRTWGDVTSVELRQQGKTVFSFQIADRSVQLEPLRPSPWPGVLLDDLSDLVASKMVALVERGAPRDFLDIYNLCRQGIVTPEQCWRLWGVREGASGNEADVNRALLAVQLHQERIAAHRPLSKITDPTERKLAEQLRRWFREEFQDAARN